MNRYSFTSNGKTWVRVSKGKARSAYNSGATVAICPVNIRPFLPWHSEIYVSKGKDFENSATFEDVERAFKFYNCNSEAGRYAAFYVQDGGAV